MAQAGTSCAIMHRVLAGCGKSRFAADFGSTGAFACAVSFALPVLAQPRLAVLPGFFRSLLESSCEYSNEFTGGP